MSQPLPHYIKSGITGFGRGQRAPQPISTQDWKAFHAQCYGAARLADASVLDFDRSPFHGTGSFVSALLEFPKTPGKPLVFVLLNQYEPLLAFASARDRTFLQLPLIFLDVPELTAPFESSYRVLKRQELDLPWTWSKQELASRLYPSEIAQIKSWKPQTVGEVIFNIWD